MPHLTENGRRRGLFAVSLVTLVQGVAAGVAALATRGLFEAMQAGSPLPPGLLAALIGSGLVIAGARVLSRLMGERLGQSYALDIRLALFDHASGMPASAVAKRRSGYMSLRFVGDMTAFRNWLGKGLPRLIAAVVMIPTACTVLWLLEPRFALVVAPLFAVMLVTLAIAGPKLELDRIGRRPTELRQLRKRTEKMIHAALHRLFWAEMLKALPDAVAGVAACAVIVTGAQTGTSSGTIAGALAAIGLVLTPLRDLASVWNFRAAYLAARKKCLAALAREQRETGQGDTRLPHSPLSVVIQNLPTSEGTTISLNIPAGETCALPCAPGDADVLFAALCGLEPVPRDHITLSGLCLTDLSRGSLRRGVHRLTSTPVVLKGSLRRNLTLGLLNRPSEAKLEKAAQTAGLSALMDRIGGLDGALSEGGRDLSAANRSALSLARILLGKPQLVLLEDGVWHLEQTAHDALAAHLGTAGATILRHPVLAKADTEGPRAA
jgi:ABC-type transport system involved in cytochrome bd biosynthesis fused ATPase/permease subunit